MIETFGFLQKLRRQVKNRRIVIMGIGNPLRGDDGFGPALVERLTGKTSAHLVNAGDVPEDYLGRIRVLRPELIFLIDSADFDGEPGDLAFLEIDDLANLPLLTHNPGLKPLTLAMREETGADIQILVVQPQDLTLGAQISPCVQTTLNCLEELFLYLDTAKCDERSE
jgi:hydrogenase 3 maturation protease